MKNIPVPVAVAVVVVIVALAGIMVFRSSNEVSPTSNVTSVVADVMHSKPKDVPPLPRWVNPTKGAIGMGGVKK